MTLTAVAEQVVPAIHRHHISEWLIRMAQNFMGLEVTLAVEDRREVVAIHKEVTRTLCNGS